MIAQTKQRLQVLLPETDEIQMTYAPSNDHLYFIGENGIYALDGKVELGSGRDKITPRLACPVSIDHADPSPRSNLIVFIEEGAVKVFEPEKTQVETSIPAPVPESEFVEAIAHPTGSHLLALLEIEKEDEEFLYYKWLLYGMNEKTGIEIFSDASLRPPSLLCQCDPASVVFYDSQSEQLILYNIQTHQSQKFPLPASLNSVESICPNLPKNRIVISGTDEDSYERTYILSDWSQVIKELELDTPHGHLQAISWSPDGRFLLFRNRSDTTDTYYLTDHTFEMDTAIISLKRGEIDHVDWTWLEDDWQLACGIQSHDFTLYEMYLFTVERNGSN